VYGDGSPVVYRWNGKTWIWVGGAARFGGPGGGSVSGLAGTLSTHVFVAGISFYDAQDGSVLKTQQPSGSWRKVAHAGNDTYGVSASSAENVWMIGALSYPYTDYTIRPRAERWNGSQFTSVTVLAFELGSALAGVVALNPNDVWAVGNLDDGAEAKQTMIDQRGAGLDIRPVAVGFAGTQPLILHHAP
jgi:hypothetical protein